MRNINEIQNDIKQLKTELVSTIKEQKGKCFKNQEENTFYICIDASYEEGFLMKVFEILANHKILSKKENEVIEVNQFQLIEITEKELSDNLIQNFTTYIQGVIHDTMDSLKEVDAVTEADMVEMGEMWRRKKQEAGYQYLRNKSIK